MECKNGVEGNVEYFCEDFADPPAYGGTSQQGGGSDVNWDTVAELLELSFDSLSLEYSATGFAYSTPVTTTNAEAVWFDALERNLSTNVDATYQMANTGTGDSNWETILAGAVHTFATGGDQLRWRADLTTSDANETPQIDAVFMKLERKLQIVDEFPSFDPFDLTRTEAANVYNWAVFDEWLDNDFFKISLNSDNQNLYTDPVAQAAADARGQDYGLYVGRGISGDVKPIMGHAWISDQNKWLAFSPGICQGGSDEGMICDEGSDCASNECVWYGEPLGDIDQRESSCNNLPDGRGGTINYLACFDENAETGAGNVRGWAAVIDPFGNVEAWVKLSEISSDRDSCALTNRQVNEPCYHCLKRGDSTTCAVCTYADDKLGYKDSVSDAQQGFPQSEGQSCQSTGNGVYTCPLPLTQDTLGAPEEFGADVCHNYFTSINNQAKFEGYAQVWDDSGGSWAEATGGNQKVVWGPNSSLLEEPQHCRNGVLDASLGELGIDCGGSDCQTCGIGQLITSFVQVRFGSIFAEDSLSSRFTPLQPEFSTTYRLETSGIIRNLLSGEASLSCQPGQDEDSCGFIREGVNLSFFRETSNQVYANEFGTLDIAGMLAGRYAEVISLKAEDVGNGDAIITLDEFIAELSQPIPSADFPLQENELGGKVYHIEGSLQIDQPISFNYGGLMAMRLSSMIISAACGAMIVP